MANENLISAAEARLLLSYDPKTGQFKWKQSRGIAVAGSAAGYLNPRGYILICINRRLYRAHRLAFLIQTGEWPIYGVDHINGVKNDNRWENLRDIPDAINIENKHQSRSGRKHPDLPLGVMRSRSNGKPYLAKIQVKGRSMHLGRFDTIDEAQNAYINAKRLFHKGCTL